MTALRFAWQNLFREWKSGEHAVLTLALVISVTALTAVGFFTSRVGRIMEEHAGELIAADLRLESPQPLAEKYFQLAQARGLKTARIESFPSVVLYGENSVLSAIRAVSAGYPLRGRLKVADTLFGVGNPTDAVPAHGEVWAESRLLARLGATLGATLDVGRATLKVTRILDYRPDQGSQFVDLAPTLLINIDDVPATQLIQPGSRVSYVGLFAGAPADVQDFKQALAAVKARSERLVDIADASPQFRKSMDRAGRFINLTAMVSVLLAAIAVAMAARRYAARRFDIVALMKSMGASQRLVLNISMLELLLLGLAASVVGTALGYIAQAGIAFLLKDLVRGDLPSPSFAPAVLGLLAPLAVLVGFALPPLLQLSRVPPARVLRRNIEPPPLRYIVVYGAAMLAVGGMLLYMVRDLRLVGYVLVGVVGSVIVLYAAGWLLVKSLGGLRGSVGVAWRYGMANVVRRGRESIVQVVAFGLGLMVLLHLTVVRHDLLDDWRNGLPEHAPNQFLINIRPEQVPELSTFFTANHIAVPIFVPMVRARLADINGEPVQGHTYTDDRAKNFVDREANLTWSRNLPEGNKIASGSWWRDGDGGGARVSVENGIATALGLKLGDRLTYDVAGIPVTATVTSTREVEWDSFKPNFFMVFSPGVLDSVTGTYITSVHIDSEQRAVLTNFYKRFPEITAIDIDAIIQQVRGVMDDASRAVQYVFLFAILAGITVLLAAIQSTRDERRYESAMLRTLGASRSIVLQGVATEFTVLGVLAGTLAATGASLAGYFFATHMLDLKYHPDLVVWLLGWISGALLVGTAGTLATRSVVNHPPAAILKEAASD